jgi:hypothetical protein
VGRGTAAAGETKVSAKSKLKLVMATVFLFA